VNQLGGALLSILLLPRLLETAKKYGTHPRLTLTTSGAVYFSNLIEDLHEQPAILEKLSDPSYCTPKYV
jgi:retinol dehydrogenase 12